MLKPILRLRRAHSHLLRRHGAARFERLLRAEELETRLLLSFSPSILKDADPQSFGSIASVGSEAYFAANDPTHGYELWKSDGTSSGTSLVKDINPGSGMAYPSNLTNVGGELYFAANNGVNGDELWKSDGTSSGTVLVDDIDFGAAGSYPSDFTGLNGLVFFSARDGSHGYQLWKTDGTSSGTAMVLDIQSSAPGGGVYPSNLTSVGGALYFTGYGADSTYHIWKSDGTSTGTAVYADTHSSSGVMTFVGSTLFYEALSSSGTTQLWKNDGSGNVELKDLDVASTSSGMIASGGRLYLDGWTTPGVELWTSDGTATGTVLLDTFTGVGGFGNLTDVDGELYFSTIDTQGNELWKSDGTASGTTTLTDLHPASAALTIANLVNVDGRLYFSASSGLGNDSLWSSDGTSSGTAALDPSQVAYPGELVNVNGALFFKAEGSAGEALWRSNGTVSGTSMVAPVDLPTVGSYPQALTQAGSKLFFTANSELWASDGTSSGTVPVAAVTATELINVGGELFFQGTDGTHAGLWKSDGTSSGTVFIEGGIQLSDAIAVGSELYFTSSLDNYLWESDGTAGGTRQIVSSPSAIQYLTSVNGSLFFVVSGTIYDFNGSSAAYVPLSASLPENLFNDNGELLFTAFESTHGSELWADTSTGTAMLKDIHPGSTGSYPAYLTMAGGTVFFQAKGGTTGYNLWETDGTNVNQVTSTVVNLKGAAAAGNRLFFDGTDNTHGTEPWVSDGTSSGTFRLADINPGTNSSGPYDFTNVNGTMYFIASDGTHTQELWKSDGTTSGTVLVTSMPSGVLANSQGTLAFAANDQVHGWEPWHIGPVANTPSVTGASTSAGTQTTSGLVITRNAADGAEVPYYQITGITGGTLFQSDGTTPITNGQFITVAQGAAGLKFTPTVGAVSGSFQVQASTSNNTLGLGGSLVTATVAISGATTLTLNGSAGGDHMTIDFQDATHFTVTQNGTTTSYTTGQVNKLDFAGASGGNEVVIFEDNTNTYAATLSLTGLELVGPGFEFDTSQTTTLYVYSTGNSAATIGVGDGGSASHNFFVDAATGGYGYLADPGTHQYSELSGFQFQNITGSAGTTYAYIYSTSGAATVASKTQTTFTLGSVTTTLSNFPQVYVVGAPDGTDHITLDSSGGEFVGAPQFSYATDAAGSYLLGALYASNVVGQASNAGSDVAYFYSYSGNTFNGTVGTSSLAGSTTNVAGAATNFSISALSYLSVNVFESGTGDDTANLTSPGNGSLISQPTVTELAVGTSTIVVNTFFAASPTNLVPVAGTIVVTGASNHSDQAELDDSAGATALVAGGSTIALTFGQRSVSDTRPYRSVTVNGFGQVTAKAVNGSGDTLHETSALDFALSTVGSWTSN